MKYLRRRTRPARKPETEPLEKEIARLKGELLAARLRATLAESTAERLLDDKVALVNDLRDFRNRIDFLEGHQGVGHEPWDISASVQEKH